jgi:hypothetical protein
MFGYSLRILAVVAFSAAAIGPASSMSPGPMPGVSNIGDQFILAGGDKVDTNGDGTWDIKGSKERKKTKYPNK